jgi:hypothetical protein
MEISDFEHSRDLRAEGHISFSLFGQIDQWFSKRGRPNGPPSFICENILGEAGVKMVMFKLDAQAKVQGTEDQNKYPIVARVLGTGEDGSLSVQVSGEGSPISARISGDSESPISVAPISIVPDLRMVAETLDLSSLIDSLAKVADGLRVEVAGDKEAPLALALEKVPVDLSISVLSPAQETVFKVEIKGIIG